MVGEEFIQRWVRRARHEVPDGVAVFLVGSHARGDAGPHSDLDLDVLVADGPRNQWPTWLDVKEHQLVCVSLWIRDFTGLSFQGGIAHLAWSDNSNSTGTNPDGALQQLDIYIAAVPAP